MRGGVVGYETDGCARRLEGVGRACPPARTVWASRPPASPVLADLQSSRSPGACAASSSERPAQWGAGWPTLGYFTKPSGAIVVNTSCTDWACG
eukprot:COSAG04_NODE_22303_length_357_cov_0.798450_1_plen_93_part_10